MPDRPGLISRLLKSRIQAEARELAGAAVKQWTDGANAKLQATASQLGIASAMGRSSGAKWNGGLSKPIGGRITWHWNLRQQARDIVEDSIHAYNVVHRKADMVIDQGLTLNPTPVADVLGISPEEAEKWRQKVAQSFEMWANSKKSHRSGLFNFKQAQHQLQIGKGRDNDEFMRLYYPQRQDLPCNLQWEIIDANQIRGDAVTATNLMPLKFFDGIERNPDGSERLYKIWVQDPGTTGLRDVDIPRIGEKSGRTMMLHGFQPEYSGQGRGYSQMGIYAQEYELLEDYILSIIKKAINQSQNVLAVEPSAENPASNPWESLGMPPAGPQVSLAFGNPPATGGISIAGSIDGGTGTAFTPVEEATFGVPGSTLITNLAEGEKIKMLENTVPGPDFDSFIDAYLTPLLGWMSLEVFKIQFSTSYSSARGALALLYRFVNMERAWWDSWCGAAVYEAFLSCEIAAGRISCPGWQDPRMRAAWCSHTYIGSPPIQIDPTKETTAAKEKLSMSVTDLKAVTHEIGTGDLASNMAANKRDFPELAIPPWEQKLTVAATTMAESEEKQDQQAKDQADALAKQPKAPVNGNGSLPKQPEGAR
jgi:capsid protein